MTGIEGMALLCLTLNVFKEARGEPIVGQLAVAFVTINRTKQTGDVCDTVFAPKQFSWVETDTKGGVLLPHKRPDRKSKEWKQAEAVAKAAFYAKDFTHGATHFHNTTMTPTWAKRLKYVGQYGEHRFYK